MRSYYETYEPRRVPPFAGGGFVVIWTSIGQDGSESGVYGQLFDGTGAKVGSEFQVNTYTTGNQVTRSVAALVGGGFVVIWASKDQDGSDYGVYGQRFDRAGAKAGSEFQVNTYTTDLQALPRVTALTGGGFVVTWHSNGQDGSYNGIYGQQFDGAGGKGGNEFRVNAYTTNTQSFSSVASLTGGGFVVIWQSDGQDGSNHGVYGRLFPVNSAATTSQSSASLTATTSQTRVSANNQPQKASSTTQSTTTNMPKPGVTASTLQASYSESNQATKQTTELQASSSVTKPKNSITPLSTSTLSLRATETVADRISSSGPASSQTPLIAGVAAALACSLLSGGLFHCLRKKADDESSQDV